MAVSALLLGFMMLNLTSCSKDEENEGSAPTEKENGGKDDDKPVVVPDVVVTVDDNGQADGGHRFQKIDETSFYIDDIKYTAEQGDLVVAGYNEAFFKGAAVIISTLKYQGRTMDVTSIKNEAFKNCIVMTSCIIGNKVTRIGRSAFSGCSGLTSVVIPSSVTSLGEFFVSSHGSNGFLECIGSDVFSGCSNLTSITVEQGNGKYDSRDNCNAIIETASHTLIVGCKNTTIPSSVMSIGYWAFSGCSGLQHVYCYAVNPPSAWSEAFYETPIFYATLHVPAKSLDAYRWEYPWCDFGNIVALGEDGGISNDVNLDSPVNKALEGQYVVQNGPKVNINASNTITLAIPKNQSLDKALTSGGEVEYEYVVGSYTKSGDTYSITVGGSVWGSVTITPEGEGKYQFKIAPKDAESIVAEATKTEGVASGEKTDNLCRTWKPYAVRIEMLRPGATSWIGRKARPDFEDVKKRVEEEGYVVDDDFGYGYELERISFDNAGGFTIGFNQVKNPDAKPYVGAWSWRDQAAGTLHYTWAEKDMGNSFETGDAQVEFKTVNNTPECWLKLNSTIENINGRGYQVKLTICMCEFK